METTESKTVPVPIPTSIPSPPPLNELPFNVLHSATVDMLIQQNDDLVSRLKINIRRNSHLEQKVLEFEKIIKETLHQKESLKAQIELNLEKEKKWSEQKQSKDEQIVNFEKKIKKLNLHYTKLYMGSQSKRQELEDKINSQNKNIELLNTKLSGLHRIRKLIKDRGVKLQKDFEVLREKKEYLQNQMQNQDEKIQTLETRLSRLFRIKNKAKERLRAFLLQTAKSFLSHQKQIERIESTNRHLMNQNESQRSKLNEKENQNEYLNRKTQNLHEKIENLQNKAHNLNLELSEEKKNRFRIKSLGQEINDLKNEKIEWERKLENILKTSQQNQQEELEKSNQLQRKVEELQFLTKKQTKEIKNCESKLLDMNKDNQELSNQLSSLQVLWVETQEKLEKAELKAQSLEKINRELALQYKDQRMERITQRVFSEKPIQDKKTWIHTNHKSSQVVDKS